MGANAKDVNNAEDITKNILARDKSGKVSGISTSPRQPDSVVKNLPKKDALKNDNFGTLESDDSEDIIDKEELRKLEEQKKKLDQEKISMKIKVNQMKYAKEAREQTIEQDRRIEEDDEDDDDSDGSAIKVRRDIDTETEEENNN